MRTREGAQARDYGARAPGQYHFQGETRCERGGAPQGRPTSLLACVRASLASPPSPPPHRRRAALAAGRRDGACRRGRPFGRPTPPTRRRRRRRRRPTTTRPRRSRERDAPCGRGVASRPRPRRYARPATDRATPGGWCEGRREGGMGTWARGALGRQLRRLRCSWVLAASVGPSGRQPRPCVSLFPKRRILETTGNTLPPFTHIWNSAGSTANWKGGAARARARQDGVGVSYSHAGDGRSMLPRGA